MDEELQRKLARLKRKLPGLLSDYPQPEAFYHAFSEEVSALTVNVKHDDLAWFEREIALMLAECGKRNRS